MPLSALLSLHNISEPVRDSLESKVEDTKRWERQEHKFVVHGDGAKKKICGPSDEKVCANFSGQLLTESGIIKNPRLNGWCVRLL